MFFTVAKSGYGGDVTGRKRDIDYLRGEIQELFADLWQVPGFAGLRRGFRPQSDCFRTDDPPTLHVIIELPGVDPGSVEVVAANRVLVVAGVRERPQVDGARYLAIEIEYGAFERRIELGEDVHTEAATARYDRGMLKVVLPIAQRETRQGRVPVDVGRSEAER
jgi:HSP20 family molecular chaperone IbpA